MIDAQEKARIQNRLRMGNSPKRIALDYPETVGIREMIEDIRQQMLFSQRMRAVDVVAKPVQQVSWCDALPLNIGALIIECCDRHDYPVERLFDNNTGLAVRQMIAHALRHRWAKNHSEIGEILKVTDYTAANLSRTYKGPNPTTVPPMPEVDAALLPMLRRIAGEHQSTEWAIIHSAGLRGVALEARQQFVFHLYFELAWDPIDIVALIPMATRHVSTTALCHIARTGKDVEACQAARGRKLDAAERAGRRRRYG